jgi:hypothetical protein
MTMQEVVDRIEIDHLLTLAGWRIAERIEETSYSTRLHRIAEKGELGL